MRDEPELGAGPVVLVVRGDEAEDVVVTQHAGLVHLPSHGMVIFIVIIALGRQN